MRRPVFTHSFDEVTEYEGWVLTNYIHDDGDCRKNDWEYGYWSDESKRYITLCGSLAGAGSYTDSLEAFTLFKNFIDSKQQPLVEALEHWAAQFESGTLSDVYGDVIAKILRSRANDIKFDQDLKDAYNE